MAALRIGVNALYLIPGGVGGTEIYLRSLLEALSRIDTGNEYLVFTNRETGTAIVPQQENFLAVPQPVHAVNRPARLAWEQTGLAFATARRRVSVLLNPGFTAPAMCSCPSVTVFHDLQHVRHPEYFRWFDLPFWRLCLFQAAATSTRIIAVSEATRRDFSNHYRFARDKVSVVPHGVDERMFEIGRQRQPSAQNPYLLCVSTLHPHKNLDRLVRSFAVFHRDHPEFRLVIAGMRGFHTASVEKTIEEAGLARTVQLTGWIERAELSELYRSAHACVFPSTFEGFGLPVLEAMAAGAPTACSAIEPFREVACDAVLQFDPLDEDAIRAAMERISFEEPLRERLASDGPRRAGQFSWTRCATQTLDVLREAVSG